jgi:signal transduction histidine kinase
MSEAPHGSTGEYCSGWFARLPQRCAFRREPDPLPHLPKVGIEVQGPDGQNAQLRRHWVESKETAAPALAALDDDKRADVDEVVGMLTSNLEKITEHGRRADGIVKSMLEHSRGGSGERRSVDLNTLVEEALSLAYHGARAHDQSFNITLERDLAPAIAPIELAPQDMTRVFLNLFSNGFYTATKRRRNEATASFEPTLKVTTRDLGDAVEVRVRDNGTGISTEAKDRLFQPFSTIKPTGEGTGLGLSIGCDIGTQQHGGAITVYSEVSAYTEFTIHLLREE